MGPRSLGILAGFLFLSVIWLLSLFSSYSYITATLPLWSLVAFGSYSLVSIGHSLATVKDCPEAHEELMREIEQAKKELKAKGI